MKKPVLWCTGIVVLLAWLSLPVALAIDLERGTWIAWVTAVAVVTEIGLWVVAATLGIAVFQARQRAWQWLTQPFRSRRERANELE